MRELILGNDGVTLSDVYTAGGEVLLGTARWEYEARMREEAIRMDAGAHASAPQSWSMSRRSSIAKSKRCSASATSSAASSRPSQARARPPAKRRKTDAERNAPAAARRCRLRGR